MEKASYGVELDRTSIYHGSIDFRDLVWRTKERMVSSGYEMVMQTDSDGVAPSYGDKDPQFYLASAPFHTPFIVKSDQVSSSNSIFFWVSSTEIFTRTPKWQEFKLTPNLLFFSSP
jgi:hypothetical protein